MKTIVLTIDYTDSSRKFWQDSAIKNKIIQFDDSIKTIHQVIKDECLESDYMELSYKGKPQGNIYRDKKDGSSRIVGYIYRGKTEIYDRDMPKPAIALFDVWATIEGEIKEFAFEEL